MAFEKETLEMLEEALRRAAYDVEAAVERLRTLPLMVCTQTGETSWDIADRVSGHAQGLLCLANAILARLAQLPREAAV